MQPLLLDKGLPPAVAQGLAALGLDINAVGLPGAPPDNSSDDENCRWCLKNDAILVTTDRGRKDRAIMTALATHRVHAIFVYKDLRAGPAHPLARALLVSEHRMDALAARGGLIRHRLTVNGTLQER